MPKFLYARFLYADRSPHQEKCLLHHVLGPNLALEIRLAVSVKDFKNDPDIPEDQRTR